MCKCANKYITGILFEMPDFFEKEENKMEVVLAKTEEELASCLKVRRTVFIEEKGVDPKIEIDEFDSLNADCEHFAVFENGKAIGTFRVRKVDGKTVRLQRFCFLASVRKNGCGKKALEFLEDYYREKGISKITADAKFDVSEFYVRCGYKVVSDVFEEAGIPHVKIEKLI